MLRTDMFVQTMLYKKLCDIDYKIIPHEGFKIFEDGTMTFINISGTFFKVEVADGNEGQLHVMIVDSQNDITHLFNMYYDNLMCCRCKCLTFHSVEDTLIYCAECGIIFKGGVE